MLVSQKIIFLSLFLLHFYLPGSEGWEPLLAFTQAMSEKHTQRVYHGAMQLSRAHCHPALSQCMLVPVCYPLPCVSVTSQRTRLQRRAWKLSRENAEPKPLNYSSPNPEERAPPEGKNWDLWLFKLLELSLCSHCLAEENTFFLYLHYFEP